MSSSTNPITPGLDVDPRNNLQLWLEVVGRRASSKCTIYDPRGLIWGACTDAVWLALNNNVATPRPTFPNPGALDPAANPAAREIHKTALTAYGDHSTALAEIKADMLESIGEANREHIRDPIVGMHNHTCNSIIAAMVLLHGQYTEADVLKFTDDL